MSRAERVAVVSSHLAMWVALAVLAYLFATRVSVLLGVALVLPMLVLELWLLIRLRRQARSASERR